MTERTPSSNYVRPTLAFPIPNSPRPPIVSDLGPSDSEYRLWRLARDDPESLFLNYGNYKVLGMMEGIEGSDSISGVLIRDDYEKAWEDMIAFHDSICIDKVYKTESDVLSE